MKGVKMKKLFAGVSIMALALFVSPAQAAVLGPLTLGSTTVNLGQSVLVSGSCGAVGANGSVNITLSSSSSTQSVIVGANGSGDFSTNLSVPGSFTAGNASLVATCPNGDTLTGVLTVTAPIGGTLSLGGTPTLGQSLNVSGSCGTTAVGGTVSINLVRVGSSINIGSTTTLDSSGSFSGNFTIPNNVGGGPVSIVATCPTGTITLNSSIVDPLANVSLNDNTPVIGTQFTANGVCGIGSGQTVNFLLSNANAQIELTSSALTNASGAYSANLVIPTGFPVGPATLVAFCPTGNVVTAAVVVDPAATGGTVVLPPATTGTPPSAPTTGSVSTTPTGGVAAGRTDSIVAWVLGLILAAVGASGIALARRASD